MASGTPHAPEDTRDDAPPPPRASATRATRLRRLAPLLVPAASLVLLVLLRTDFVVDDAFIAFRYARNWAESGVPAFHLDERPPVEGYSDFLWVALLAASHAAGLAIPAAAKALAFAAALGTLGLFARHARRQEGLSGAPLFVATALLATAPPFAVWTSGGLETGLFGLLVLATYVVLGAERPWGGEAGAGVVGGMTALGVALVRVEGFLWVLVLFAAAALARASTRGRRFPLAFGVYLVGFGAFLLWRHGLYGEWLANTAGAKLGFGAERLARGARYVASYVLACVTPLVALAAAPWLVVRGAHERRALGAAFVCAAFLAYSVLVGGDWMPFWRFLAPATPFFALLAALALARLPRRSVALAGAALVAAQALPLFGVSLAPRVWLEGLSFRAFRGAWQSEWQRLEAARENGAEFERLGRALAHVTRDGDSLVFGAIGAVGWFAPRLALHDRNGLVDREVAALGPEQARGVDTAGHDRRVPRAWFLSRVAPRVPTYFHAALVAPNAAGPITHASSPGFRDAVRAAMFGQVLAQPGEEPLLDATVVEAREVPPAAGLSAGWSVLLWRRSADEAEARRFWAGIGPGPP